MGEDNPQFQSLFTSLFVARGLQPLEPGESLIEDPKAYFANWAVLPESSDPSSSIVRLIVGAPGDGKTWLILNIVYHLRTRGWLVFYLNLEEAGSLDLRVYLAQNLNRWISDLSLGRRFGPANQNEFTEQWKAFCGELGSREGHPALLLAVDGFDHCTPEQCRMVEKVLVEPFIIDDSKRRILLAYRSSKEIEDAQLKWDQGIFRVSSLTRQEGAPEQIRRLCQAIDNENRKLIARTSGMSMPDDSYSRQLKSIFPQIHANPGTNPFQDEQVAGMTLTEIEAVGAAWAGFLYPNPYVNARVMAQALSQAPHPLQRDDIVSVIAQYLERGGADVVNLGLRLEEAVRAFGNKGVRSAEFTKTLQGFRLEDFDPLLKAGLLLYDEKEALYTIDPTFVGLIAHRDAL